MCLHWMNIQLKTLWSKRKKKKITPWRYYYMILYKMIWYYNKYTYIILWVLVLQPTPCAANWIAWCMVCVFVYIIHCHLRVMYSCAAVDAGRFLERGRGRGYSNPHRSHSQIDKCPIKDWWRPQWHAAVWGGHT